MSLNRIQKLLFSEYCEFEDMVLVESPFAETTREGKGIRQVHLGLTPTKLVVATDVITSAKESSIWCLQDVDPDIETFELISVYPVDCVNLSIFRRKKRQSLKAHFCNNKVLYFELGGFEKRNMFWNLWCERVKFLCPEDLGSSHTETSVASSTSTSTMFLKKVNKTYPPKSKPQIWCTFAAGDSKYSEPKRWTDRDLIFDKFDETSYFYISEQNKEVETIYTSNRKKKMCYSMTSSCDSILCSHDIGENVGKSQRIGEYFSLSNYRIQDKLENQGLQKNLHDLSNESVEIWEREASKAQRKIAGARKRHKRIYGFFPQSHFYYGLGLWKISPGDRVSVQMKRAVSLVTIRRRPTESEFRFTISKRQLTASISYESLLIQPKMSSAIANNQAKLHKTDSMIHFWTPEFWYRPKPLQNTYQELCSHLKTIHEYHETINKQREVKRRFFPKKMLKPPCHYTSKEDKNKISKRGKCNIPVLARNQTKEINNVKCYNNSNEENSEKKILNTDKYLQSLKQKLCLNIVLSAWDFDSTTLAYQLTMIDRDLFLKIEEVELGALIWQRSSQNAPNISAIIAFSHRISSLITTEILREEIDKLRARLIARFITTADKCNKIFNFQSCRSILYGLQSPSIYRLHSTWSYVRQKHASKYFVFEKLCRLYRDPRMPNYQRAFRRARKNHPYIPYIGDLLIHLLDKLPEMSDDVLSQSSNEKYNGECIIGPLHTLNSFHNKPSYTSNESTSLPNILRRFLSAFRIWPHSYSKPKEFQSECNDNTIESSIKKSVLKKHKLTDQEILIAKKIDFLKSAFYVDNRNVRLQEVCDLLNEFQKACSNYALCTSDLANEYLLKARYRENKDNYVYSFEIEPKSF